MSKKKLLVVGAALIGGAAMCISKAFKKDDYIEAEGTDEFVDEDDVVEEELTEEAAE